MSTRGNSPLPRTSNGVARGVAAGVTRAVEQHARVGIDVAEYAEVAAVESVDAEGVRLGHVARALDLVVEDREHAAPGGLRRGGESDRVEKIEVGVAAQRARRAHGAGDDDRTRRT